MFHCLLYIAIVVAQCFRSRSDEYIRSAYDRCRLDFRWCLLPPRWLVTTGRPCPCSSGQWRLEATLGQVPLDNACPAWVQEADCGHGHPKPCLSERLSASSAALLIVMKFIGFNVVKVYAWRSTITNIFWGKTEYSKYWFLPFPNCTVIFFFNCNVRIWS